MPPLLHARPPADPDEQRTLRRLAASRHAPADWILRARIVVRSWDGARASQIAARAGLSPQDRAAVAAPLQYPRCRRAR
jgi:hypothetical protein